MSLFRRPTRRSASCFAVTVALVALVATACGGGGTTGDAGPSPTPPPETNGLEHKSAAEVQQAAAAALKTAKSVHVNGTARDEGKLVRLDVRIQGNRSTGTMEFDGMMLEITNIGETTYIRADASSWTTLGVPAASTQELAGHWVKIGPEANISLTGFTLADLAADVTKYDSPLRPQVVQAVLDGRKVVILSKQDGSKLHVANTGPAYPLWGVNGGVDAGEVNFSEYGANFHITPPGDAMDFDTVA